MNSRLPRNSLTPFWFSNRKYPLFLPPAQVCFQCFLQNDQADQACDFQKHADKEYCFHTAACCGDSSCYSRSAKTGDYDAQHNAAVVFARMLQTEDGTGKSGEAAHDAAEAAVHDDDSQCDGIVFESAQQEEGYDACNQDGFNTCGSAETVGCCRQDQPDGGVKDGSEHDGADCYGR